MHRIAPQARVLVVDDLKAWRSQIRQILQMRPEWEIVSEAGDGVEAVQKATDLQPDIILLDIGLPRLNGMKAGEIIRQRCPKSRIVFVTQEADSEIRSAATAIGDGYVLKVDAVRELVNTIAAALEHHVVTAPLGR